MVTKPVKPDFDTLAASIADLRDARAKLNADRNAIGGRIREILDTPPAKSDLKDAMHRVIERFAEVWNKPLTERLQAFKLGAPLDEFVSRHASIAANPEFVQDNGWFCLIVPAMLAGVDPFVDQLDWPEGLPAEERAQRLAKLQTELAPVQSQIEAIDRQFSEIGANPVRPAEAII